MKIYNSISMNEYLAKIIASFFGWIAGLATLAHIKLPFLTWSWLPTVDANGVVIVIIGMFKAGLMAASSFVAVTGMQYAKRKMVKRWRIYKSKKQSQ